MTFSTLLVANRGEIALRIIRAARAAGLRTVAVYSDADADAPHVRAADAAERIGPAPAAQSYLSIPALVAAARRSGAEAVHPGYGFLSERSSFAQGLRRRRAGLRRPAGGRDRADGPQRHRPAGGGAGRGAGVAGGGGRQRAAGGRPGRPRHRRDRVSVAGQGGRGRRREGDADRPGGGRPAGRARGRPARGRRRVRRRHPAGGKVCRARSAHRGADPGRHARQCGAPFRAGLLGAATPPEGDRGGAGGGHLGPGPGRRHQLRGPAGPAGRLRQRRHRRIPGQRR